METNRCQKCRAELKWIKTIKGKSMPADPKLITIVTEDGEIVKGYTPHWATCNDPDHFRNKSKRICDMSFDETMMNIVPRDKPFNRPLKADEPNE